MQEITEYILIGYEQHTVVAECQELVAYISQQLSYWAESDAATTDAALDVLNGLSFTQKGQKASLSIIAEHTAWMQLMRWGTQLVNIMQGT